jgi:hypothetical protein
MSGLRATPKRHPCESSCGISRVPIPGWSASAIFCRDRRQRSHEHGLRWPFPFLLSVECIIGARPNPASVRSRAFRASREPTAEDPGEALGITTGWAPSVRAQPRQRWVVWGEIHFGDGMGVCLLSGAAV